MTQMNFLNKMVSKSNHSEISVFNFFGFWLFWRIRKLHLISRPVFIQMTCSTYQNIGNYFIYKYGMKKIVPWLNLENDGSFWKFHIFEPKESFLNIKVSLIYVEVSLRYLYFHIGFPTNFGKKGSKSKIEYFKRKFS